MNKRKMKNKIVIVVIAAVIVVLSIFLWYQGTRRCVDPVSPDGPLKFMKTCIMTFYKEKGRLPNEKSWKEEILDYTVSKSYFNDRWGSTIKYLPQNDSFCLYSFGKNKSDENGGGDDILLEYDLKSGKTTIRTKDDLEEFQDDYWRVNKKPEESR